MTDLTQSIIGFVQDHPGWAAPVVFLLAFCEFDIVVAAVHYKFDLPRAAETERIIRIMDQHVSILAHPTGRLDRGARCLRARYGPASRHCA